MSFDFSVVTSSYHPDSGPRSDGPVPAGLIQAAGNISGSLAAGSCLGEDLTAAAEPEQSRGVPRPWQWVLAGLVVVTSLLLPLRASGIWQPYELEVAELGRRIAIHVFGASELVLHGADNSVVTAGQLGRGELPFTSIALGFRCLGLHEWAGRLPLALWSLLGLLATALLLARLCDRSAALLGAMALATMPLYFLQARTMLGDAVTMGAVALGFVGLALSCFDGPRPGVPRSGSSTWFRALALVLAAAGLLAGFLSRGLLIGVSVPTLGVGLGWAVLRLNGFRFRDRFGELCGAGSLLAGLVSFGWGALLLTRAAPGEYCLWLGFSVVDKKFPAYDTVLAQLGHGLFPWSAFAPFAVGRITSAPVRTAGEQAERESALRVLLLTALVSALGVHTLVAPWVDNLAFSAVFAVAGVVSICLRDWERGAQASAPLALGTAALFLLLLWDFKQLPAKALEGFAVADARFPESFEAAGFRVLAGAGLVGLTAFFLCWLESSQPDSPRLVRAEYLGYLRALSQASRSNLLFVLTAAEAALIALGLMAWLDRVVPELSVVFRMSMPVRRLAYFGWIGLPLLLMAPLGALLVRDLLRAGFAWLPVTRPWVAAFGLTGCGLVLSLWYYPVLSNQLSPKDVFSTYRRLARPGQAIGLLGMSPSGASYYARGAVAGFDRVGDAYRWLVGAEERRWLVFGQQHLAELNSWYRGGGRLPASPVVGEEGGRARRNLPVLDARSSEILLAASSLGPGEVDQNPLRNWVLDAPPAPGRRLDANLGGQLEVLGWDVTDKAGRPVSSILPGTGYEFRVYYRVVTPVSGKWEAFVHIDGHNRRHNADHQLLAGKYPPEFWHPGDYIVDVHAFALEPSFVPGTYQVFFGLFSGSRRLEVRRGPHQDNRIVAGSIEVR